MGLMQPSFQAVQASKQRKLVEKNEECVGALLPEDTPIMVEGPHIPGEVNAPFNPQWHTG